MRSLQYELRAFAGDETGSVAAEPEITFPRFKTEAAARRGAGRMAKRVNGPVALARAGVSPWERRYISTASPSEFHALGYRFERLT